MSKKCTYLKIIEAFFSVWTWKGPTGCTGPTGITGTTGIQLTIPQPKNLYYRRQSKSGRDVQGGLICQE